MARWFATPTKNAPAMKVGPFQNKREMFNRMREALGVGGEFSCYDSTGAAYIYRISAQGYYRIDGDTPERRRRAGRKAKVKQDGQPTEEKGNVPPGVVVGTPTAARAYQRDHEYAEGRNPDKCGYCGKSRLEGNHHG